MSLESDLYTALQSQVSGRMYPDFAPMNTTRPYITYQQVGGSAVNFLESAVVGKRNARIQLNYWAETRAAAMTLARACEDALVASTTLRAFVLSAPVSVFEDEMTPPLYGCMQDFSIWYS